MTIDSQEEESRKQAPVVADEELTLALPGEPPAAVRALDRRAQRMRQMGRYREAADLWTGALADTRFLNGGQEIWRVVLYWESARAFGRLGQLGKASHFYRRALELAGGQPSEASWTSGSLLSDLSEIHRRRGEPLLARSLAERALATIERESDPVDRLLLLSRLGRLYAESGCFEHAEQCFLEALQMAHSSRGTDHHDYGTCVANLAELYRSSGRHRDARAHYRWRWAWCRDHLGPRHPESASALVALAELCLISRHFMRAAVLYRHAWHFATPRQSHGLPNKVEQVCIYPLETITNPASEGAESRGEPPIMSSESQTPAAPAVDADPAPDPPEQVFDEASPAAPISDAAGEPSAEVAAPMAAASRADLAPSPAMQKEAQAGDPEDEARDASSETAAGDEDSSTATDAIFLPDPELEESTLGELRAALEARIDQLKDAFAEKLAYDAHKDRQIDLLHRELQEHKQGLLAQATRPLIAGLVRLHDDLGRSAADLAAQPAAELSPQRLIEILTEFQDDVEILLEENGVTLFLEPVERFDPHRQTLRQTVETREPDRVGEIVRRLRPGFERDSQVLLKERVEVYVLAPDDPSPPQE